MKLDIKSFLIGILTTVNLFLLMGFDNHEEENQNGRYQVIIDSKGDQYWYDTRFGDKIAIGSKSYGYILLKEEGGMEKIFEKEYQLVEALKEKLPVERMFREVRTKVIKATNKKQTPWESSSLIGEDFYFTPFP